MRKCQGGFSSCVRTKEFLPLNRKEVIWPQDTTLREMIKLFDTLLSLLFSIVT